LQKNKDIIVQQLQQQIMQMGGIKPMLQQERMPEAIRFLEDYMPNKQLPLGAIHQFVHSNMEQLAASQSFILALCAALLPSYSSIAVISSSSFLYPPALVQYGIAPERVLYIKPSNAKELLWCTEEALKCTGFAAVLANLEELNLLQSRRMQLAVEQSGTTGFVLSGRKAASQNNTVVSRWQVQHNTSSNSYGLPGVGVTAWQVQLQKIRNGTPGKWLVQYNNGLKLYEEMDRKLVGMKAC
jgi:protein ImuA